MAKRYKLWSDRLAAAEKRGKFTEREHDWSQDWTTCAVGERHNYTDDWQKADYNSPTWKDGFFKISVTPMYQLGVEFGSAVCRDDIPEAKRIYAEILALP